MLKRVLFGLVALVVTVQLASVVQAKEDPKAKVTCPVTGRPVVDLDKAPKSEYKGQTYYFCCPSCKEKFDRDPEKYVGKAGEGQKGLKGHDSCGGSSGCDHQGH